MKIILKTLLKWFYCTETLVSLLFVVQTNWLQCQVKLSLAWQSSLFGLHCLSQDTDPLSELVCIVTRSSVQRLQRSVAFGNTASLARSSSLFLGLTHCIVQTYQHCISRWAHVWPWGAPGGVRFASTSRITSELFSFDPCSHLDVFPFVSMLCLASLYQTMIAYASPCSLVYRTFSLPSDRWLVLESSASLTLPSGNFCFNSKF